MSTTETPASFDGWIDDHDTGVPPIAVGPVPADGGRWLCLADPEPPTGLSVSRIVEDLERTRGYRDRHSQGGGLSLFLSGLPLALALRHLQHQPVPLLEPATTWCRISEYGNLRQVVAIRPPPCARLTTTDFTLLLHSLMDPAFAAIRSRTRFALVAQWAQFTSALADLLLTSECVPQSRAVGYLSDLSAADPVLQRARPRYGTARWQGRDRTYAVRRVCCFNYRGTNGAYCDSLCPMVDEADRTLHAERNWAAAGS